ncbi:MAG: tetratricopeptide repeat protein [Candidatus Aminicenantes bacterium]|nr:tetratricopeptide repeat protein [Candidatus Aminicenantes bacterium]
MRRSRILPYLLVLGVLVPRVWTQDKEMALINAYAALSPHIEKARAAFRKDRLDKCETEALTCLRLLPEHQEAHFLMSLVLYKRGEFSRALEHLQAAEAGYLMIAEALFLVGRQNLQRQSEDVIRLTDELADLAAAYAASKSHGSGLAEKYDQALQDSRQEMTRAEEARGRPDSNREASAIPALYRYWHGNILFMLKRPAEAETEYRQAIAKDPDFRETYNNLINLLFIGGRVDEARAILSQAEVHKAKIHPELKKAVLGQKDLIP